MKWTDQKSGEKGNGRSLLKPKSGTRAGIQTDYLFFSEQEGGRSVYHLSSPK